jgi:hypothetical protein
MWKEVVGVLMILGASSLALGAEDEAPLPAKKTAGSSWLPFWSGSTDKADKKVPAASSKPVPTDATHEPQNAKRDDAAEQRTREQATLLRRLAVCDQLRLIATQKKDDQLMQQAEQLDERCWQVYMRRIERLPVSKAVGDDRVLEPRTEASATEPPAGGRPLTIRE